LGEPKNIPRKAAKKTKTKKPELVEFEKILLQPGANNHNIV
jgi:hypothetical protein